MNTTRRLGSAGCQLALEARNYDLVANEVLQLSPGEKMLVFDGRISDTIRAHQMREGLFEALGDSAKDFSLHYQDPKNFHYRMEVQRRKRE